MFRSGARRSCGVLDVYRRAVDGDRPPRIGVVVPRHGRTIVERNRLERRLREILRTRWLPSERERGRPSDVLVRARAGAYDVGFAELRDALTGCLDLSSC